MGQGPAWKKKSKGQIGDPVVYESRDGRQKVVQTDYMFARDNKPGPQAQLYVNRAFVDPHKDEDQAMSDILQDKYDSQQQTVNHKKTALKKIRYQYMKAGK